MTTNERDTPLTDAVCASLALKPQSQYRDSKALGELAEQLERMCAELAEACELQKRWYNSRGDAPRKLDAALSWTQNDNLVDGKVETALARYGEMLKGAGK